MISKDWENNKTFLRKNFVKTNNKKDKIYTETITNFWNINGYRITPIDTGLVLIQIEIGKYKRSITIDKVKKNGFECIKYIGDN